MKPEIRKRLSRVECPICPDLAHLIGMPQFERFRSYVISGRVEHAYKITGHAWCDA